jgi:hypothetical protein
VEVVHRKDAPKKKSAWNGSGGQASKLGKILAAIVGDRWASLTDWMTSSGWTTLPLPWLSGVELGWAKEDLEIFVIPGQGCENDEVVDPMQDAEALAKRKLRVDLHTRVLSREA